MRICVTGADGLGKTTFINQILEQWSVYKSPNYEYHNSIKDLRDGVFTKHKQKEIINCMFETYKQYGKKDNVVYDRGPIDCLAYTLYGLNDSSSDIDEQFVDWMSDQVKNALRMIDLILFVPITRSAPMDLKQNAADKEADYVTLEFIHSIDAILKAVFSRWDSTDAKYLIKDDKPHFVEIFGLPEQRLHLAKFYIAEDGDAHGESSIITPAEVDELEMLNKRFGLKN